MLAAEILPKAIMQDQDRFGLPTALSSGEVAIGNNEYQRRDWFDF